MHPLSLYNLHILKTPYMQNWYIYTYTSTESLVQSSHGTFRLLAIIHKIWILALKFYDVFDECFDLFLSVDHKHHETSYNREVRNVRKSGKVHNLHHLPAWMVESVRTASHTRHALYRNCSWPGGRHHRRPVKHEAEKQNMKKCELILTNMPAWIEIGLVS